MTTLTTHSANHSQAGGFTTAVMSAVRGLTQFFPFTTQRRGYESVVGYYETAAAKRAQVGDEAGARYYASHAAALREALPGQN